MRSEIRRFGLADLAGQSSWIARALNPLAVIAAVGLLSLGVAQPASALVLTGVCITGNLQADCDTGVAQFVVDVTDPGGGQALFTFSNIGPDPSIIADVYFDDGALFGIASIDNSSPGQVSFSHGASPDDLPGGNSIVPPFVTTVNFLADADPPTGTMKNGVDPGEFVGILFDLQTGFAFSDVLSDLSSGALRVGIHGQGFGSGSESFVYGDGVPSVPEPSTLWLFGAGLAGLGLVTGWRRRKATA